MKIVVTGASGHLGRSVVHLLASQGHEIVAVSRGSHYSPPFGAEATGHVRELVADVSQDACIEPLSDALAGGAALVHLAAWHPAATAATTTTDRSKLLETNVLGTMRVYDAARRAKATAVVYASTFEVYGDPRENPITESSRVHPVTDYGASKLAGEDHLFSLQAEDGIRGVSLRMPAIYGAGEHTPRALPNFLAAAARGEAPTIYGGGDDLRDLLHVRDAARAVSLALLSSAAGIFNVTDGEAHSIRSLAQIAMAAAGLSGAPIDKPRVKPRRDYHLSIEKARRELGYQPSVALAEGVAEQLAWLRSA
jgi:UDP-glucose 4-epimerase